VIASTSHAITPLSGLRFVYQALRHTLQQALIRFSPSFHVVCSLKPLHEERTLTPVVLSPDKSGPGYLPPASRGSGRVGGRNAKSSRCLLQPCLVMIRAISR
jgi:hypothetical protein